MSLAAAESCGYLVHENVGRREVQGASREADVFEINVTPLIFSVEFVHYHEMITLLHAILCKIRLTVLSLIPNSTACRRAERVGLLPTASITLSTFSGVRAVASGPGGLFCIIVPLVRKDVTHLKMVLRLGMFP